MRMYWLLLVLVLFGCKSDPIPVTVIDGSNEGRTLKVNVKHLYRVQPYKADSVVQGAFVSLFTEMYDLQAGQNKEAERITDSLGSALFEGRQHRFYYVLVTHPELGNRIDSVTTLPGAISYLEILYY